MALTAPPPVAPAAPPAAVDYPAHQPALSTALARLHTGPDGAHELSITLHPADLGTVQIRATLHAGTLDVTVACADEGARQAVVAALPSLHHQLGALGPLGSFDAHVLAPPPPHRDAAGDAPPRQPAHPDPDATPRRRPPDPDDEEGFERWM